MKNKSNRRKFLQSSAIGLGAAAISGYAPAVVNANTLFAADTATPPLCVSSSNGVAAVTKAVEEMRRGADPLDAAGQIARISLSGRAQADCRALRQRFGEIARDRREFLRAE